MTVFLDAGAIIYLLEGDAGVRGSVQVVLRSLRSGDDTALLAVSALSRLEYRVRPLKDRNERVLARYAAWFSDPGLLVVELGAEVIDLATELRAGYGLRTPDALQAACALATDRDARFVTGDRDFERVSGLRVHAVRH